MNQYTVTMEDQGGQAELRQRKFGTISEEKNAAGGKLDLQDGFQRGILEPGLEPFQSNTELPPVVRHLLGISASSSKRNKMIFAVAAVFQQLMFGLLFYGVTRLAAFAVSMAILMPISMISAQWNSPNFSESGSIWNRFLLSDRKHVAVLEKRLKGQFFGTGFNMLVATPLLGYFFILPLEGEMVSSQPFGPHSWTIAVIVFILGWISTWNAGQQQFLSMHMIKYINEAWAREEERHVRKLRSLLLKMSCTDDINTKGPNYRRILNEIATLQDDGDKFAREVTKGVGTVMAFMGTVPLALIVAVFIIIAAGTNPNVSDTGRIVQVFFMCFMGIVMLCFFFLAWFGLTRADRDWLYWKRTLLNDARIKDLVGNRQFIGPELWDEWLQGHELAATRVAGIRVTMRLLYQVGSAVISAMGLALYFLVRDSLKEFL